MDSLKLHQMLNYYPAIGLIVGTIALAAGILGGNDRLRRFSLKLIFIIALLTILVAFTGEFAGASARGQVGPHAEALASHRLIATAAFAFVEISGIAALVAFLREQNASGKGRWAAGLALVAAIAASALVVAAVVKGRQVKWAGMNAGIRPAAVYSTDMENYLWHA